MMDTSHTKNWVNKSLSVSLSSPSYLSLSLIFPISLALSTRQVLIIPQSPYIHAKKSKGRTVLKTRTDMIQLESEDEVRNSQFSATFLHICNAEVT